MLKINNDFNKLFNNTYIDNIYINSILYNSLNRYQTCNRVYSLYNKKY